MINSEKTLTTHKIIHRSAKILQTDTGSVHRIGFDDGEDAVHVVRTHLLDNTEKPPIAVVETHPDKLVRHTLHNQICEIQGNFFLLNLKKKSSHFCASIRIHDCARSRWTSS